MATEINEKHVEALRRAAADAPCVIMWTMHQELQELGLLALVRGEGWSLTEAGRDLLAAALPEGTATDAVRLPVGRAFRVIGTAEVLTLIQTATSNARTDDREFGSMGPGAVTAAEIKIAAHEQALLDLLAHRDALAAKVREQAKEIDGLRAAVTEAGRLLREADVDVERLKIDRKRMRDLAASVREDIDADRIATAYAAMGAM